MDLITAHASLPTDKPRDFTASIDIVADITLPPPISILTTALTAPSSISFIVPFN